MSELHRILVVDDEERIRFFLQEMLQRDGYTVITASSGEQALDLLRENAFDLILLDLMLGGQVDGQRVLEAVRWRWPETLVIMITAHGTLDHAVEAIQQGVDGYLLKPVRLQDVRQAIAMAVHRREQLSTRLHQDEHTAKIEKGLFAIDFDRRSISFRGDTLDLTPSEFNVLAHMIQNAGQVLSPKDLVRVARQYEPEYMHEARRMVKWYIHRLRQKIEPDPSDPQYIVNVRGVGYVLEMPHEH